jgi:hypothetical protein
VLRLFRSVEMAGGGKEANSTPPVSAVRREIRVSKSVLAWADSVRAGACASKFRLDEPDTDHETDGDDRQRFQGVGAGRVGVRCGGSLTISSR